MHLGTTLTWRNPQYKGRRDVGQGHSLNLSKPGHKATRELRLSLTITLKKPDPTGTRDVGLEHLTLKRHRFKTSNLGLPNSSPEEAKSQH